jgi:hypothetical protein
VNTSRHKNMNDSCPNHAGRVMSGARSLFLRFSNFFYVSRRTDHLRLRERREGAGTTLVAEPRSIDRHIGFGSPSRP